MELINWLLHFGCSSEELRVLVSRLSDWVANSSPPWAAYRALMACRLVALDKIPGVGPVGIRETLRQALDKLVMRAAGYQAKAASGNLQLCAGLTAGIEVETHAVGQRRLEMSREIRIKGGARRIEEEENVDVEAGEEKLTVVTSGKEEEAAERLRAALEMEVDGDGEGEGDKEGYGTQGALGDLDFLTQDADLSGKPLVDACNGFNELSRLAILCTVRHCWPTW